MPDVPAAPVPDTISEIGSDSLMADGVTPTTVGKAVTLVPSPAPCWAEVALARWEAQARINSMAHDGDAFGLMNVICGAATTVWLSPESEYSRAMAYLPSKDLPILSRKAYLQKWAE